MNTKSDTCKKTIILNFCVDCYNFRTKVLHIIKFDMFYSVVFFAGSFMELLYSAQLPYGSSCLKLANELQKR